MIGVAAERIDVDEVERRLDAGDTVRDIATDLGVTDRTIRNHLHAAGVPLATQRRHEQQRRKLTDTEWLREQFVAQGRSPSSIAAALNVPTNEVLAALDKHSTRRRDDPLRSRHFWDSAQAVSAIDLPMTSGTMLCVSERRTRRCARCRRGSTG